MKKLLLLLLFPLLAHAQIIPGVVGSGSRYVAPVSTDKTYVTIPDAPTFTDSHTLVQATTGVGIQVGDTGGKFDLVVGSAYTQMQFNGLTGTYRVKSDGTEDPATWRQIGGLTNDYSTSTAVSVPTLELYNLKLRYSDNLVKFSVANPASTIRLCKIFSRNAAFGCHLINESVLNKNYTDVTISYCSNHSSGGEFNYLGNTGASLSNFLGTTTLYHNFSDSAGREGIQMNNHENINVYNNTCINGGQDILNSGIGQSLCFQLQGVGNGNFYNNILSAKGPGMIASTGVHIYNNFISWTQTDREIYIQDISANGYHFETAGDTLIIEDNIFYCPGYTLAWMFRLQEENCHVIIRNNVFPASAATTVVKDERSSTPYTLTVTGNTFTDSPPVPTLINHPNSIYSYWFKVVSDDFYFNRHMGALTP
jgi:hypothetical protein